MKNLQSGFANVLIVLVIALAAVAAGSAYFLTHRAGPAEISPSDIKVVPSATSTPAVTANLKDSGTASKSVTTMELAVSDLTSDTRVMPRTMGYSASYPVAGMSASPHDTAVYTVDYGDGTKATMKFENVGCPVDGPGSCQAYWSAPSHTFTTPGFYTAVLYKNGVKVASKTFLIFAADLKTSTPAGPTGPGGPYGDLPLAITFMFTGGTKIDYGDGNSETLCTSNCTKWSSTVHTLQHTYTTPGYHQAVITFNSIVMEGVSVSVLNGKVTSISPASGPMGTKVTLYGTGFTSNGKVDLLSFCRAPNTECANFTLQDFSVASDASSITFTIPGTYSTTPRSCTAGGGCTAGAPETHSVPAALYDVGFDDLGFPAELPVTFTITK